MDHSSVEQEVNQQLRTTHNQPGPLSSDTVLDIKSKEVDGGPSDPLAIRLVPAPDINALDVFPNPFALSDNKNAAMGFGLVATGLPGIEKTWFLFLIWHLRRAENPPTLFMVHPNEVLLWKDNVQYKLMISQMDPDDVLAMIPSDAWCLVDSNRSLADVPEFLMDTGCFVIQASSPREFRMEWKKKHTDAYYLVMKPWTAEELISGLQLQRISRLNITAELLVNFRDRFGGSARDAYRYASDMSLCEAAISGAAQRINKDVVERAFTSSPSSLKLPTDGHMLLSVFPLSDRDCREYFITSPSEHLYERVLSIINKNREVASLRLYSICLDWPTPGPRALAAQIFERYRYQIKHS
ncbi:hypothetical protein BDP27DRAFT_1323706 [Rhodocollybia butyracea]|uniref:Uncharacterized protein n=1 Tax=Rhodocollybia butyracea TaxID=206335 RepID=A0A9P5U904_9AGAR|nr:hypothetical protein BDP27DRAFT_1323706 [Rhodocollybia butyracea]